MENKFNRHGKAVYEGDTPPKDIDEKIEQISKEVKEFMEGIKPEMTTIRKAIMMNLKEMVFDDSRKDFLDSQTNVISNTLINIAAPFIVMTSGFKHKDPEFRKNSRTLIESIFEGIKESALAVFDDHENYHLDMEKKNKVANGKPIITGKTQDYFG